ncbi:MAG TPA: hypothetical protein DEB42_07010 [Jeotgalicoccus sp.]|nr:hypothetical protein [Jeotgalicoccus sp.]
MNDEVREYCSVNTNIKEDNFVGIKVEDNKFSIHFPLGYGLGDTTFDVIKDVELLFKVLRRYGRKDGMSKSGFSETNLVERLPLYSYLDIYKYFLKFGYFQETEDIFQRNGSGKTMWDKTIKLNTPYKSGDEYYYFDFIKQKKDIDHDHIITNIHKYCLNEAYNKIGWLYNMVIPEKPKSKINIEIMIIELNKRIKNTFKTVDKELFKNLKNILMSLDFSANSLLEYGTYHFEYVWENMIDDVLGEKDKENYFPRTSWEILDMGPKHNRVLEPDTIFKDDDFIVVIDAKYYRYSETDKLNDLPASSSINKQITYGEYVHNKYKNMTVYSAFLLPANNDFLNLFGVARADWKSNQNTYEEILGVFMDIKLLMKNYINSSNEIKDKFIDNIKEMYEQKNSKK